jgi:sirohydrochlorin ferrochelatase
VKLGSFVGKKNRLLSMNCSSSSDNGVGFSSEGVQQQIEGDKDAVMIVDHGSRREESNLMLSKFV